MLNTILGKIGNIAEKDFLFSSFLPTLLFFSAIGTAVSFSLGLESLLAMIENLSATRLAWTSTVVAIGLIVAAYVVSALRTTLIRAWSGDAVFVRIILWGFVELGRACNRARFRRLELETRIERPDWRAILRSDFEQVVASRWTASVPQPSPGALQRAALWFQVQRLRGMSTAGAVRAQLTCIAGNYLRYNGNSLRMTYQSVKLLLSGWANDEDFSKQNNEANLKRSYGSLASVKPSRLGNVIDAYNLYAYSRFSIEAELAWPRLEQVIPDSFAARLREAKVTLDFALATCTLALVFGALALLGGPWLVNSQTAWVAVAVASAGVSYLFYLISVEAAMQYGELIRSAFDLFRLALLDQLGFARPENMEAERALWLRYSQLIVYGTPSNLALAPKAQ